LKDKAEMHGANLVSTGCSIINVTVGKVRRGQNTGAMTTNRMLKTSISA